MAEASPLRLWREMPPALRNLLGSDILIRFCERIPDAFVVIWATRYVLHPVSEFTFALYYLIRDVLVAFAAFGGALLWQVSPELNLQVAFGFGVLGTVWFAWSGREEAT